MKKPNDIVQFLLANSFLDSEEFTEKKGLLSVNDHVSLEDLVDKGLISQEKLNEALRRYFDIPEVSLTQVTFDPEAVNLIPEDMARRYTLFPYQKHEGLLKVAMTDPSNERTLRMIRIFTGLEIVPVYAKEAEINAAIRRYLTVEQSVAKLASLTDHIQEEQRVWRETKESSILEEDAPSLKLVYSILQEAVIQGVSDIHWEPHQNDFVVRYRIDGKLLRKHTLSFQTARTIISSLKVMANMDVAERRIPQDGRVTFNVESRRVDLRMSSLPTVYGEKIVVRILDPEMAQRSLENLGMRLEVKTGIQELLNHSNGLILVVGPTGSGKTTTLYALLRELNAEELNIISIEDPVEYQLDGINQVQVNCPAGLSFAVGLRHILRQDPDVIMIGEIRDEETARIAITASLTGHLVLSTLHTNTAAEALVRFLDMGIEPYLLASAVSGVLSQRLVRRLCDVCKANINISEVEKRVLNLPSSVTQLYRPKGCSKCLGTGFKGRIGIHEFLLYNQEIKELVLTRHNSRDIERQAILSGMVTVYDDGLLKMTQGLTTLEEILFTTS